MSNFNSNINWKKVSYESELDEFQRIASYIIRKDPKAKESVVIATFKKEYSKKSPVVLTPTMWKNLSNTDSYGLSTFSQIDSAIKSNESSSGKRNISNILDEILSRKVRCPIILRHSDTNYELIAGNTRLMALKVIGITPKVIVVDYPNM